MRHCREDYQLAIRDFRESVLPGTAIPADEPVFLLRAQDPFAAGCVAQYATLLQLNARNDADHAFARLAQRQADLMATWPRKKEFPDAPGVNAPGTRGVEVTTGPSQAEPPFEGPYGTNAGPEAQGLTEDL